MTKQNQPKVALIKGITGQDGSYLDEGYIVHCIKRRASRFSTQRTDHIYQDQHFERANFKLHYGDLSDPCYFRPAEVETLLGDQSKAKAKLGWAPEITVQ